MFREGGSWGRRLTTAAVCLMAATPAVRGQQLVAGNRVNGEPAGSGFHIVARSTISLDSPTPGELSPAGTTVALGSYSRGGIHSLPPLPLVLVREIPDAWEVRLPSEEDLATLDVRLELESPDGRPESLSAAHGGREGSIGVRLFPTPPTIVSRDRNGVVVRGGVVLELDLGAARTSGQYLGRLHVTVEQR